MHAYPTPCASRAAANLEQTTSQVTSTMFTKILIANRGDQQPQGCAAAQQNRLAARMCRGGFATGDHHVH
ncbi:hypothetical protein ACFSQE_08035 [Vogesella fluminis]|uniref:Uncharacterized protein n=1 Tax=Vogesella fluminis TaxID=1069161 RepID=A0ABQ3HC63_9NEIS|nr:hypothetical protein GCM10011419_15170 [Vogesella fluminis]